jgi:hypothetical protein
MDENGWMRMRMRRKEEEGYMDGCPPKQKQRLLLFPWLPAEWMAKPNGIDL